MAGPTPIPVSYTARADRHPQNPPQRAFLGVEPMSAIADLPSPMAPMPLPVLISSMTSSKPRRIALHPSTIMVDGGRSASSFDDTSLSLISPVTVSMDVVGSATSLVTSTKRPSSRQNLLPAIQGQVNPLRPSSLTPDILRRCSDETPPPFPFPNSLHKLRDRETTPSAPRSIRGSISGETTIKAGSAARHMNDLRFILSELSHSASSVDTIRLPLEGPVDELAVEWCVRCGKARERGLMELKDVMHEGEEEVGRWWICKDSC